MLQIIYTFVAFTKRCIIKSLKAGLKSLIFESWPEITNLIRFPALLYMELCSFPLYRDSSLKWQIDEGLYNILHPNADQLACWYNYILLRCPTSADWKLRLRTLVECRLVTQCAHNCLCSCFVRMWKHCSLVIVLSHSG